MCLSVPAEVIEINNNMARVSVGGAIVSASIDLLDDVQIGDYVLVHSGFAIQKIDEDEAMRTLELFDEFEDFNDDLDDLEQLTGERII